MKRRRYRQKRALDQVASILAEMEAHIENVKDREWRCPCGGTYSVGKFPHPTTGVVSLALIHTMPCCINYQLRDMGGFLEWARTEHGGTAIEVEVEEKQS
jgi:hypothetical protein